jgi:hypothetical protein
MSGPTKDELVEQLAITNAKLARASDMLDDLDDEAKAVAECVRALRPIAPRKDARTSYTYTSPQADAEKVGRVLRYLAERYGVRLVEVRQEPMPCDRPHLENASEGELVQALRFLR